ncbi:GNAT family N-acetyltransferase [Desulfosporosinus fructosivorans]
MEVELKVLTREDFSILQALLVRCSDYLIFQDDEPVKSSAAQDLFSCRPEGVEDKDKVLMGIFVDGQEQLVGVFELIEGYPVPKTLTLALMVLEHFSRGKGIGSKAYEALEEWAISRQHNRVRLGVLFGNEKGLKFWLSMGYSETGEIKPYSSKKFMVLEKTIGLVSDNREL